MQQKNSSRLCSSGLKRGERNDPHQQNPEKPAHSQGNLPLARSIEVTVVILAGSHRTRGMPQLSRKLSGSVPSATNSNGGAKALGLNEGRSRFSESWCRNVLASCGRADQGPRSTPCAAVACATPGLAQPRVARRPKGGSCGCKTGSSEKACYATQVDKSEWPAKASLEPPCRHDRPTGIPGA